MKKSIFLIGLSALVLTSCDPVNPIGTFDVNQLTAETLMQGATFSQYNEVVNEDGTVSYQPCDDGNWIEFNLPNVNAVNVFYLKKDGSEGLLSYGKSGGMFNFTPSRGSDPVQTVYFRYINADNQEVVASKEFTLQVAQELSKEMKLLCSNSGSKTWTWLVNGDTPCWGNAGYEDFLTSGAESVSGHSWWGVTVDGLAEQITSYNYSQADGDGAYMTFYEDGSIVKSNGGTGSFKYVADNENIGGYEKITTMGRLKTEGDGILFPVRINAGVTTDLFDIVYLTATDMVLAYPNTMASESGAESWMECTFWRFTSKTDIQGALTDYSEATWTWFTDDEGTPCWGNGGYSSFLGGGSSSLTGNQWWGVDTSGLADQITNYGYGFNDGVDATMTFKEDGSLVKSSGGKGGYSFDLDNKNIGGYPSDETGAVQGHLMTTGDGILFPVRINAGVTTDKFDIVFLNTTDMVLAYPNVMASEDDAASWMECTFWRFQKVAK